MSASRHLFLIVLLVPGWARAETTYYQHVAPILKRSCAGCHSGESPKGRLSLETLEATLAGGKKGPAVSPGKPEESLLYLLSSRAKKPHMPPRVEDALPAADLEILRTWISGGARAGDPPRELAPYSTPLAPPRYRRPQMIPALVYSRDGTRLFVAGYREVLVHEPEPSQDPASPPALRDRWVGEAERILALELSPDGSLLAVLGGSPAVFGEIQLRDAATGKLVKFLRLGRDTLLAGAFAPDGRRLVVAGAERTVRILDVDTLREVHAAESHSDWVLGVAYTSDGTRIFTAGRDKSVKALEAADARFAGNVATLNDPLFTVRARPGSPQVLAAGEGREPIVFEARELKEVRRLEAQPGPVLCAAFSPDGQLAAVGGAGAEVRVYKVEDGARKHNFKPGPDWTLSLAFRPDGERLAVGGHDGKVRIFGLKDEKELRNFLSVPLDAPGTPQAVSGGGEGGSAAR